MQERGIIEGDDREIYQYGIRNAVIILMNVATAFLIGLFTEQLLVVGVFTLSFMTLRSFTGGFHCDDRLFCYISSSVVLFIPVYTGGLLVWISGPIVLLTLAAAAGIILIFSPMNSRNRKLDQKEKKRFGRYARIIVILQIMVFLILWHLGYLGCAYAVYSSICITAVFMLAGRVKLFIQLHMEKQESLPGNEKTGSDFFV